MVAAKGEIAAEVWWWWGSRVQRSAASSDVWFLQGFKQGAGTTNLLATLLAVTVTVTCAMTMICVIEGRGRKGWSRELVWPRVKSALVQGYEILQCLLT